MADLKRTQVDWVEGGEATLRAMPEDSYIAMGQKTYEFVRRVMRNNPELRAIIKAKAAELKASGALSST